MADLDTDTALVSASYGRAMRVLKRTALDVSYDGRSAPGVQHRLRGPSLVDPEVAVSLTLTYDVGTHGSGWWRNSQYESCWHASLVCMNAAATAYVDPVDRVVRAWARALFGDWIRHAWNEPPASRLDPHRTAPASPYTTHVRVFTDRAPNRPFTPTGEVYTLVPFEDGSSPEKIHR